MFKNMFKDTEDRQNSRYNEKQAQILDLESAKKRLEVQVEMMQLEQKNRTLDLEMKLKEEAHRQKLSLEEERAKFKREQEIWKEDKEKLIKEHNKELVDFRDKVKQDSDLKLLEVTTMTKLDAEQKTKQAELDAQRQISELKVKHIEELSGAKSSLNKEYYDKMTDAYQDMQANGDKNSKFVQELALKIFERAPAHKQQFALEFNHNDAERTASES